MIYMLEDDPSIRNFVSYALNNSGLDVLTFEKPSEFFDAVKKETPSLVLLDIMLPEVDGLEVLKMLRASNATSAVPVIMLTAKSTEYDKVIGLDSGADDYISKPFGIMELMSRIKALLRRSNEVSAKKDKIEYTIGDLFVNQNKHIVKVGDKEIVLTYKEFQMLCLLLKNRGTVLTRDSILQQIWGFEFDGENRTVDVHIRTLRSKLLQCGDLIETIRGIGYKIGG